MNYVHFSKSGNMYICTSEIHRTQERGLTPTIMNDDITSMHLHTYIYKHALLVKYIIYSYNIMSMKKGSTVRYIRT